MAQAVPPHSGGSIAASTPDAGPVDVGAGADTSGRGNGSGNGGGNGNGSGNGDGNAQAAIETTNDIVALLKDFHGDHADHLRILKQVDKLRMQLETPMDVLMKQWEISQSIAALNLLVELEVLEAIPKEGSITSKELAAIIGIDESAICKCALCSASAFAFAFAFASQRLRV